MPVLNDFDLSRRLRIKAIQWDNITQAMHYVYAYRVKTLGGDTYYRQRTVVAAGPAWTQVVALYQITTGQNVTRLQYHSVMNDGFCRVTLTDGSGGVIGPIINAHPGGGIVTETITVINVNPETDYLVMIDIQNNTSPSTDYYASYLTEDDLTASDL